MFEAIQHRPIYWDGLPHARRALDGRNGDWRMTENRIAKEFATLERAESYARRILAQRPGCPVRIMQVYGGCVAIVSRDALDRTWTDLQSFEPLL